MIKNVIFLNAGATADALTASNNDVIIVETLTVLLYDYLIVFSF